MLPRNHPKRQDRSKLEKKSSDVSAKNNFDESKPSTCCLLERCQNIAEYSKTRSLKFAMKKLKRSFNKLKRAVFLQARCGVDGSLSKESARTSVHSNKQRVVDLLNSTRAIIERNEKANKQFSAINDQMCLELIELTPFRNTLCKTILKSKALKRFFQNHEMQFFENKNIDKLRLALESRIGVEIPICSSSLKKPLTLESNQPQSDFLYLTLDANQQDNSPNQKSLHALVFDSPVIYHCPSDDAHFISSLIS